MNRCISGLAIKDGYLTEPGSTWRDASTWVNTRGRYKINNFRGYNATGKVIILRLHSTGQAFAKELSP